MTERILTIDELNEKHTLKVLELCRYDKVRTARALGIGTATLYRWLHSWGMLTINGNGLIKGDTSGMVTAYRLDTDSNFNTATGVLLRGAANGAGSMGGKE